MYPAAGGTEVPKTLSKLYGVIRITGVKAWPLKTKRKGILPCLLRGPPPIEPPMRPDVSKRRPNHNAECLHTVRRPTRDCPTALIPQSQGACSSSTHHVHEGPRSANCSFTHQHFCTHSHHWSWAPVKQSSLFMRAHSCSSDKQLESSPFHAVPYQSRPPSPCQ